MFVKHLGILNLFLMVAVMPVFSQTPVPENIKDPHEAYLWRKKNWTETDRALVMEKEREITYYRLRNVGKRFKELKDVPKGSFFGVLGSEEIVIDYYSLGSAFNQYGDLEKALKYYKKAWDEEPQYDAGFDYISLLEKMGRYKEAADNYPVYIQRHSFPGIFEKHPDLLKPENLSPDKWRPFFPPDEIHTTGKKKGRHTGHYYYLFTAWSECLKKAKDKTIKPVEQKPGVIAHIKFYDGTSEEKLAALKYYRDNKVRFMVEKTAKSTDAMIREKANQYLLELDAKTMLELPNATTGQTVK